jgi:hypothetical protein
VTWLRRDLTEFKFQLATLNINPHSSATGESNKKAEYVPKVYDTVLWKSGKTAFIVMRVDAIKETVDLKSTAKFGRALDGHVPWSELSYLDESQNALRVVREATE